MEVIESLPVSMQHALKWGYTKKLEGALLSLDSDDMHYHVKRCVDAGLWKNNS
jgi:hypothetical protein